MCDKTEGYRTFKFSARLTGRAALLSSYVGSFRGALFTGVLAVMVRIQRRRTKGWSMPPAAKYVGRLGNPFVDASKMERGAAYQRAFSVVELSVHENFVRCELQGYEAICYWCRVNESCHADLFVDIRNAT